MGVKEAPTTSEDVASGRFPASEPPARRQASAPERLKVVTLSPGSEPEAEEAEQESDGAVVSDTYLGCTIDGRYKVEARLGEGGMGVVYRCSHKIIGKKVAMKVLRSDLARDTEATERFLNEAKAASSIGNPHIIDISDFGQFPDGSTYFVMEFLDGMPLSSAILAGRPLPVTRIVNIAEQLAEGLSAAHQAEIVHRDLKPDNIFLISRGQKTDFVKILDFGIAKVSSTEAKLTRAGAVFGTPHYMSPEQAAGTGVDHRGDIYAFGVILYELASGKVPFDADNFMGILTQHMYKSPVPIRALVPQAQEIPDGLEAIILKCLSKAPEQRYQSMEELLEDLGRLGRGQAPEAVGEMMKRSGSFRLPRDYFNASAAVPVRATTQATMMKQRWPLVAGAVGLVLAGFIAFLSITQRENHSNALKQEPSQGAKQLPGESEALQKASIEPDNARVVLAVEPIDAHVFQNQQDLGKSPVFVDVGDEGPVTVQVRRDGFEPMSILLDGSEGKRSIKLKPLEHSTPKRSTRVNATSNLRPLASPTPKPPAKPNIGSSEIIDPWD